MADFFEVFPERLDLLNGLFFRFPLGTLGIHTRPEFRQLFLKGFEPLLACLVPLFFQGRLLYFKLHGPAGGLVNIRRHRIDLRANHGAGLIHKVNGFIRKETVGDIAV